MAHGSHIAIKTLITTIIRKNWLARLYTLYCRMSHPQVVKKARALSLITMILFSASIFSAVGQYSRADRTSNKLYGWWWNLKSHLQTFKSGRREWSLWSFRFCCHWLVSWWVSFDLLLITARQFHLFWGLTVFHLVAYQCI